jgi:hypothetical protein
MNAGALHQRGAIGDPDILNSGIQDQVAVPGVDGIPAIKNFKFSNANPRRITFTAFHRPTAWLNSLAACLRLCSWSFNRARSAANHASSAAIFNTVKFVPCMARECSIMVSKATV